jgi:hypothetical protein
MVIQGVEIGARLASMRHTVAREERERGEKEERRMRKDALFFFLLFLFPHLW